jgi:hypothetical protein
MNDGSSSETRATCSLDDYCLLHIFERLPISSAKTASLVCSQWRRVSCCLPTVNTVSELFLRRAPCVLCIPHMLHAVCRALLTVTGWVRGATVMPGRAVFELTDVGPFREEDMALW